MPRLTVGWLARWPIWHRKEMHRQSHRRSAGRAAPRDRRRGSSSGSRRCCPCRMRPSRHLHSACPRSSGRRGRCSRDNGAIDPVQQHAHHRGVVDIGIEVVAVLERPAARARSGAWAAQSPLTSRIRRSASQSRRHDPRVGGLQPGLQQRMGGERGVPHRRHAGLAITRPVVADRPPIDHQLPDRAQRRFEARVAMVRRGGRRP